MIGQTVSHYRIEEKLGEGGMGVVYRARDLSLNRAVAIKFISSEVADAERRERFQREAQTASSLNHPHILTVFEAGAIDGRQYLVTEYIEGFTLSKWSRQEKPPLHRIVELAIGIADALACAHQASIVHRDVKPENILVSRQGFAKLVDFGLARLLEGESGSEEATITQGATRPGAILGTTAYMSPEQATGRLADERSDIFSFGVVLYELLAGERPFAGSSSVDLLHAIVHNLPRPLTDARIDVPLLLRIIVEKALEKDPADRYQSMREMVVDLKRVQRHRAAPAVEPEPKRPRKAWMAWTAAAVFVLACALGGWMLHLSDFFWRNPLAGATLYRLTDFEGTELDAAISSDGKFVAFFSDRDGPFDAWSAR